MFSTVFYKSGIIKGNTWHPPPPQKKDVFWGGGLSPNFDKLEAILLLRLTACKWLLSAPTAAWTWVYCLIIATSPQAQVHSVATVFHVIMYCKHFIYRQKYLEKFRNFSLKISFICNWEVCLLQYFILLFSLITSCYFFNLCNSK